MNNLKLAAAPIGWTNDDLPELGGDITFEQCISEMALAGYTGTEIGNKYPKDPATLKRYLEPRGLRVCNAWFSTHFTSKPPEETYEAFIAHRDFLHAMGAKVIGISEQGNSIQGKPLPIFADKPVYTEQQWQAVTNGFNRLAELAAECDMKLCVHHHMGTGVQTPAEIDTLLERTNPNVYLLFDTGHLYFSEGVQAAVVDVLKKQIKRVKHVHLKDVRQDIYEQVKAKNSSFLEAVKAGVFTVPGDGVIAFDKVFEILNESGYNGWYVVEAEQDPAKANPFEYAVKARTFIKEKTGK